MKAVMVFCEGRHDIVFVQRSLGLHGGCRWVEKPIGKLPSPFGPGQAVRKGLIARRLERHIPENLTLRAAATPSTPCFESVVENEASATLFFLVRASGKDDYAGLLGLLEELKLIFKEENDVSEYAAAFLFDADQQGVQATLAEFGDRYGSFFGDLSSLRNGEWCSSTTVPVGCFVFHKDPEMTGTLEDHLAPMAASSWPARYSAALHFIKSEMKENDKVSKNEAERLKAVITATGQFNHPGDPMSVIIGRNGLPNEVFKNSPLSKDLTNFLKNTPWEV